jgi:transmembrane sensor
MTVDDDLIAKYLSGEATPEEAMALNDWLESPVNRRYFDELESTWDKSYPSRKINVIDKGEAWRKIKPARAIRPLSFSIGIAASVVLVLIAVVWIYYFRSAKDMVYLASKENVDSVHLPDESTITLNKYTEIKYPKKFEGNTREINLEFGEAFFSITKDPAKPFIVHASFSEIRVVGTQFNVNSHDGVVEVGVNEGIVLVVTPSDSIYLEKGATAVFSEFEKATSQQNDVNTWAYATKKLVFKDTPMPEVIKAIEKAYPCVISFSNDNIKKCPLTASFETDSVDKIVLLISESLNLKVEQNGKVFILQGEGCP